MKKICYIVPYFGKFPINFQIWLNSCEKNNTIDWLIFTDDKREFYYPSNVKVNYITFEELKNKIQSKYDFNITIDSYWNICLFKPAFGEIFEEYIKDYDFWGHCDIDLIWGNIREFITEDILNEYEKIGYQGHSTLYRNSETVNSRYKTIVPGKVDYKKVFSGQEKCSFDENEMEYIYEYLKIPYYKKTNFAHLSKYEYSFFLWHLPEEEAYKNRRQVFVWDNGELIRFYIDKEKKLKKENFMYIHFFCRPIKFLSNGKNKNIKYVIYPDVLKETDKEIDIKFVEKYGKNSKMKYYITSIWYNRKKLTIKKIIFNIKSMHNRKLEKIKKKMNEISKKE